MSLKKIFKNDVDYDKKIDILHDHASLIDSAYWNVIKDNESLHEDEKKKLMNQVNRLQGQLYNIVLKLKNI
jgi:hypothetical protein